VDEALAAARKAHGQERILVNCAGIGIAKRISRKVKETGAYEAHDLASFAKVIHVNLIGTFLMMAKASTGMQTLDPINADGERGVMICTSSVAAQDGQIGQVAYSASKGGVYSMTLPVARDRWRRRCRSPRASAARRNTRRSPRISSRTPCSTASASGWTARSAWRHGNWLGSDPAGSDPVTARGQCDSSGNAATRPGPRRRVGC
jgi:NAD(P)-dependent dehydrogenase (short-subunit alcohol dehydrogenase family)